MRQNYRRENSSTGKAYRLLDSSLPIKPSFTVVAAAILIVFIVFTFTCFAAVTFEAASAQLAASDKAGKSCSQYYAAEAAAIDILTTLSSDDGNSLTDKNGELKYGYSGSDITISRNGGNFSFDVPINKKESLHVIAQITGGNIDIVQWYTK